MTEQEKTVSQQEPKPTTETESAENNGEETPVVETESIETQKIETGEEESQDPQADLKQQLEQAQKQVQDLKDSWARERAEFQNYKRRTATEFANVRKQAIQGFVSNLLNPLDNLERVVGGDNQSEEIKPFVDGVKMIRKEFLTVLERENIRKYEPQGEVFDPMTMEAIASEEREGLEDEQVIEVYQSGYQIVTENEQPIIIRPSRVKVGRPKN